MNKKALLGKIVVIAIIIIIIMGTTIYFSFTRNSLSTTIGKITFGVSYDPNKTNEEEQIIKITEIPAPSVDDPTQTYQNNSSNYTEQNNSLKNLSN